MRTARVKVKICGITNWADARCACSAGAHFLGFNFYRGSLRYIDPKRARSIVQRLPKDVASVGVFVNEPEKTLVQIADLVGLTYLQLHGDETPALVSRLRRTLGTVKIIKAVRVRRATDIRKAKCFNDASAILLDGFDGRWRGGTGRSFEWSLAAGSNGHQRIFLAGGLTPENVAEAIRVVHPYAVDVCSGVESSPGKKDPRKIESLMRNVSGRNRSRRKAASK